MKIVSSFLYGLLLVIAYSIIVENDIATIATKHQSSFPKRALIAIHSPISSNDHATIATRFTLADLTQYTDAHYTKMY